MSKPTKVVLMTIAVSALLSLLVVSQMVLV
ncbi:hypothetical protein SAMN05421752_105197 [Natronorubrum thiooxidans]|uniref:Uncharacterized protein n=1 Tax=Natronorubrum thiooxidans TaxID=308853 RepID=A0A1N7EZ49_9EURY|nr:hypothetical protein SAMN05421752_105197 [Natronorubrum thiooxidans]